MWESMPIGQALSGFSLLLVTALFAAAIGTLVALAAKGLRRGYHWASGLIDPPDLATKLKATTIKREKKSPPAVIREMKKAQGGKG